MINYIELLKAELQKKRLPEEVSKVSKASSDQETRPPDQVPKVSKEPSGTFGTSQGRHVSQTNGAPNRAAEAAERAASIPRGYTRAELEAARLDAQRLGYSGRTTIH